MTVSPQGYDITWLLWLDTLERLDTILLELRHHQVNLIHALRSPALYAALRYEEDYIWGGNPNAPSSPSWLNFLSEPKTQKDLSDIAAKWVIPFPGFPETEPNASPNPEDEDYWDSHRRSRVELSLKKALWAALEQGRWPSDKRRLYHALRALQTLKINILYHKLTLCRWGIRAIRQTERPSMVGRFLIVRAAVMKQAHDHIQRLGDLRAQFEAALDLGIQDHPKPLVGRRREQGIYSSYLSERCNDLRDLIENFLYSALGSSAKPFNQDTHGAIYMHRWNHSAVSDISFIHSSMDYGRPAEDHSVDLFNTSFFMPDRPDLQSVIAHEASHAAILHGLGDLEPHKLKLADGTLATLFRLISACFQEYGISNLGESNPRYELRAIHREVACDIIAAIVTGPAYLFALTQEILGQDLDLMFSSPLRRIDFNLADHILESGWVTMQLPGFEWYLRLMVCCTILEELTPASDVLARRLIAGVRDVSDNLLKTVEVLSPPSLVQEIALWRGLVSTMTGVVCRSELVDTARNWHQQREAFAAEEADCVPFVSAAFPDSARQLPAEFRNKLLEMLKQLKQREGRLLHASLMPSSFSALTEPEKAEFLDTEFRRIYLEGEEVGDYHIFRYLYDIPWQSAMLRARDFMCSENGGVRATQNDWLREMHLDGAPGRHLYQIALELAYWLHNSSVDAGRGVIGYLQGVETQTEISTITGPPRDLLTQWFQSPSDEVENQGRWGRIVGYAARISGFNPIEFRRFDQAILDDISDLNPRHFVRPFDVSKRSDMAQFSLARKAIVSRLIAQFHLVKIDQLRQCLDRLDLANLPRLHTLKVYLDALCRRQPARAELLAALTNKRDGDRDEVSPLVMLDRVIISEETYNKLTWDSLWQKLPLGENNGGRVYTKVLGRYDVIGLTVNEPPSRSFLPQLQEGVPDDAHVAFFERHEMAVPVRLNLAQALPVLPVGKVDTAVIDGGTTAVIDNGPIAFLCVTLGSRASRLDFLHRLISLYQNKTTSKTTEPMPEWHEVGNLLSDEDHVLLSEGWGDVVIVFNGSATERLEDIFRLQSAIYEDFLVDQTEMILAGPCLVAAVEAGLAPPSGTEWPYTLITRVKVKGNAGHSYDNQNYRKPPNVKFVEKIKTYLETIKCTGNGLTLTRTPGRTDFTLHFYCPKLVGIPKSPDKPSIYDYLDDADEVLTIIARRIDRQVSNLPIWTCPHASSCPV
jgi:hypothetical protein